MVKKLVLLIGIAALFPISAFAISDYEMDWKPATKWIGVNDFAAATTVSPSSTATDTRTDSLIAVSGQPSTLIPRKAISTFGITGWEMSTGDELNAIFPVPENIDTRFGVAFRVYWASIENAANGSVSFRIKTKYVAGNVAVSQVTGTGTDSTTCTSDSSSAQYTLSFTKFDTLTYSKVQLWRPWNGMIELTCKLVSDGDLAADQCYVFGVELVYVPKNTDGAGVRVKSVTVPGPTILSAYKGTVLTRP